LEPDASFQHFSEQLTNNLGWLSEGLLTKSSGQETCLFLNTNIISELFIFIYLKAYKKSVIKNYFYRPIVFIAFAYVEEKLNIFCLFHSCLFWGICQTSHRSIDTYVSRKLCMNKFYNSVKWQRWNEILVKRSRLNRKLHWTVFALVDFFYLRSFFAYTLSTV
jgi:hypothetical protein